MTTGELVLAPRVLPRPWLSMSYSVQDRGGWPVSVSHRADGVSEPGERITVAAGQRIRLRFANPDRARRATVTTIGIPLQRIGNAKQPGRAEPTGGTHSVTVGEGESVEVLLDTEGLAGSFFLLISDLHRPAAGAANLGQRLVRIVVG